LTEEDKYNNWKTTGNPDGSMSVKAVELLLPTFLFEDEMRPMWITCLLCLTFAVGLMIA